MNDIRGFLEFAQNILEENGSYKLPDYISIGF